MAICPSCFAKYPDEISGKGMCPSDGTQLVSDETFAHVDKDLSEGTVVGEYRIESKLGQGGFGAVYRAVHPLIGKMAAVKVLSRQYSSNPEMISRFVHEARAVNQIRHRNIIDIFSFGQLPDGRQYYIMELLEGASFDQYIARKKRLTIAEALPILRGVARALDAAHSKGILHRDLKPENVFLVFEEDGRIEPKLLDFGLVKLLSMDAAGQGQHKTKTGTPMGTPYYMSPEQCRGLEVDGRTDVYSFGAMVFEVLTGDVPFDGVSTMDILVQHMTSPPPSASAKLDDIPIAVDNVLMSMLAKEPADRPIRVGEALDQIAKAANMSLGMMSFVSSPALVIPAVTDSDRAIATTLIAEAPNSMTPQPAASGRLLVGSQTFLGAETDVSSTQPRPARSRALIALGVLGVISLISVIGLVVVSLGFGKKTAFVDTTSARTTDVESAAPAPTPTPKPGATAPIAPLRDDVDVRVDGAPDGTVVSANGVELGKTPGPFKLKTGVPAKLTFVAKGWKTKEMTITPTENVLLPIALDKATGPVATPGTRTGGGKGGATPGSTINRDLEGFDNK